MLSTTPLFAETIRVVWDPPPDAELVVRYAVYQDGNFIGLTANPYLDSVEVPSGTTASFSIVMYRYVPDSGNYVLKDVWLTTVTYTGGLPVAELCGSDGHGDGVDNNGDGSIDEGCAPVTDASVESSVPFTLAWDPPPNPGLVLEYRVYVDGQLIGTTPFLELPGIQGISGTTRHFWVTSYGYALDGSGTLVESQPSEVLTYTFR